MNLEERGKLDQKICSAVGVLEMRRFVCGTDRGLMYLRFSSMSGYTLVFTRDNHIEASQAAIQAVMSSLGLINELMEL